MTLTMLAITIVAGIMAGWLAGMIVLAGTDSLILACFAAFLGGYVVADIIGRSLL